MQRLLSFFLLLVVLFLCGQEILSAKEGVLAPPSTLIGPEVAEGAFLPVGAFWHAPIENPELENPYQEGSYRYQCFEHDSYIPLSHQTKQAAVWTFKSLSLALSTCYLIAELTYPIAPENPLSSNGRGYAWPLFRNWCHNMPSRTFQYSNGCYMPLCARCTGLNCGIFLGHFDSFIWDSFEIEGWERWQQGLLHMGSYSLLTLPLIIDGFVQLTTDYESSNGWRFITGVLFSYGLTAIADELLQLTWDYAGDIHPAKK